MLRTVYDNVKKELIARPSSAKAEENLKVIDLLHCTYTHIHLHNYIYRHTYTTHIHTYIHIYIHTHTYTHTYTHTHI